MTWAFFEQHTETLFSSLPHALYPYHHKDYTLYIAYGSTQFWDYRFIQVYFKSDRREALGAKTHIVFVLTYSLTVFVPTMQLLLGHSISSCGFWLPSSVFFHFTLKGCISCSVCLLTMDSLHFYWLESILVSSSLLTDSVAWVTALWTFPRHCILATTILMRHLLFVMDLFPLADFKIICLWTIWEVQVWISFRLSCFVYFEIFRCPD